MQSWIQNIRELLFLFSYSFLKVIKALFERAFERSARIRTYRVCG